MTIENTSDRPLLTHLVGMMGTDGQSGYIQEMESAGQSQLLHADVLPTASPWDELARLGFIKGEPITGDPLFTRCTLPEGWSKVGTSHAMHSDVLDERGVRRVGVFFKAAFYDRRADAHLVSVGRDLSTEMIYGDAPVSLPAVWDVLTSDERADLIAAVQYRVDEDAAHPEYEHRADRRQRAVDALALLRREAPAAARLTAEGVGA